MWVPPSLPRSLRQGGDFDFLSPQLQIPRPRGLSFRRASGAGARECRQQEHSIPLDSEIQSLVMFIRHRQRNIGRLSCWHWRAEATSRSSRLERAPSPPTAREHRPCNFLLN
jgi:hypothetical protein